MTLFDINQKRLTMRCSEPRTVLMLIFLLCECHV
jgi:hypothetical protein